MNSEHSTTGPGGPFYPSSSEPAASSFKSSGQAAWVDEVAQHNTEYKRGMAKYVASHLVEYGMVLFVAPGTTNNEVMREVFDLQTASGKTKDLVIVTNNLTVLFQGVLRAREHPELFATTQIIITGGKYQSSINSVVGRFSAAAIGSGLMRPHIVLMGATGVSFAPPAGRMAYHFEEEIDSQRAFGTCHTNERFLICDHTKLGRSERWSGSSLPELLENTSKCTIITSYPREDEQPAVKSAFDVQLREFRNLVARLRESAVLNDKRLSLRAIDVKGSVVCEFSSDQPEHDLVSAPAPTARVSASATVVVPRKQEVAAPAPAVTTAPTSTPAAASTPAPVATPTKAPAAAPAAAVAQASAPVAAPTKTPAPAPAVTTAPTPTPAAASAPAPVATPTKAPAAAPSVAPAMATTPAATVAPTKA